MKMKNILFTMLLGALSFSAYAETWEYDPLNPENNTKTGNWNPADPDLTIDVSNGTLTVTGIFENKGKSTVIKGANTATTTSDYKFSVTGSYIQQHGILTLENVNISSSGFYNENTNSVLSIKGNVSVVNLQTKNNAFAVIEDGAKLTARNIEVYKNGTFEIKNAKAKTLVQSWEFKTEANSKILFDFSNDTLACVDSATAVVQGEFLKTLNSAIALDFTNISLNDTSFIEGNTYRIALIYCHSNQTASGQFDDSWKVLAENVVESSVAKFAGFEKEGNMLYVNVQAVPEPATYAAIFGALALAFVAYRRRK